jgi:hypothetical protein
MITAQVESLTERLDELKPLFPLHWQELALNQDKVPLDPQYEVYLERDARGEVVFVTLRKDGGLVGYFVGFIAPGLHYRTCLTLTMDIFYLHPGHRDGSPTAAIRLFRAVEREARRRGVQRWFVGAKLHNDAGRLFTFLRFEPVETYYSLWLGD